MAHRCVDIALVVRTRQRVSCACFSRLANWSCNSLNIAAVVQLYRLAKVVSTLSAKKPSDICGRLSSLTLHTFKVICHCIIRKPLRAFIIICKPITNGYTSQDIWQMTLQCIYVKKITNCSGSTPVRRFVCSKFLKTSCVHIINNSSLATFFSLTVKAHVHSVTRGQLWKPQHTYVKHAVSKAHFKLKRTFRVIQGHHYWCQ